MLHYLMVKEIEQTGLKYLCKHAQFNYKGVDDHIEYRGSGKLWRRILDAHPEYTLKTEVLGLFNEEDIAVMGGYYSELWNVVESSDWANLKAEEGDGGVTHKDTHPYIHESGEGPVIYRAAQPENYIPHIPKGSTLGKIRIHNKLTGKISHIAKDEKLPDGWEIGGLPGFFKYGPDVGSVVYNNGITKIYLSPDEEPPEGWVRGSGVSSTRGRIGIHNPQTGQKMYIEKDSVVPEGWVKGLKPSTGKSVTCPHGFFVTISQCMLALGISREKILKNAKEDPDNWKISNLEVIK